MPVHTDSALSQYLAYYQNLSAPGYAVLVTGPWGVGKTFQVKQAIDENNRYYVSLYGLESVGAINDAVLAACLPNMKAGDHLATIGEVGKAMGDKFALAGLASSVWTTFLRSKLSPNHTLIFDDLERSPLWASENEAALLGAINQYVEHGGFRAVVICHDDKIADKIEVTKEKTFGHTVRAEPQTESALDNFLSKDRDSDTKKFLFDKKNLILEVWKQSGQSSLRILMHVINDICRLYSLLEDRHRNKTEAVDHLIRYFTAMNVEIRAGRKAESLFELHHKYMAEIIVHKAENTAKPISELRSKYPTTDLTHQMLSDDLLQEMFVEGRFNREKLAEWLDQTSYFVQAEEAAPWQIVINFDQLENDTLQRGIERMQAQFVERSVTIAGEFFHIAALRLMMAENNALPHDVKTEEHLCFGYIEDLLLKGRLPPKPLEDDFANRLVESYGGHAYWGPTRPELQRIMSYWDKAATKVRTETLPEHAENVLTILRESPLELFKTISYTSDSFNPLWRTPILHHISPSIFIDAWLGNKRSTWHNITMALENRYDNATLDDKLKDERNWLLQLDDELERRIEAEHGLDRLRLQRIKPKIFDTIRLERTEVIEDEQY